MFDMRIVRILIFAAVVVGIFCLGRGANRNLTGLEIIAAVLYAALEIYYTIKQKKAFVGFIENFDFALSDTTGVSLVKYPSPAVIIDLSGEIKWYNGNFKRLLGGKEVFGCRIQSLIPQIQVNKITESRGEFGSVITVNDSIYEIEARVTGREDSNKKHKFLILYFIDKTDEYTLAKLREEEKTVEAIVIIDNYEEVLKETPDSNHGKILGEIEQTIGK